MKKSLKKVSGFVAVLLVLGLVLAGCGAQKKDLTGKWTLDTISVYGIELKAADVVEAEGALSEIGFDIKDEAKVEFVRFSEIFEKAFDALLKQAGVSVSDTAIDLLKAGLAEAGISETDITKYYKDLDTQTYTLTNDQFEIKADDKVLLSGVLKDDNTIAVSDFYLKDFELTFTRNAK